MKARATLIGARGKAAKRPSFAYVQSLERGLAVIKSFSDERPQQTVADVARAAAMDRSAARRFLLTLVELGYVEQDGRDFRLTPRTLQLGYGYLSSLPWWRAAQRIAEQLTASIGVSTAVGVLDGEAVVYLAYSSAGRFPQLTNRSVGTQIPAAASAIGRVLMASLPPDQLRAWLGAARLERYTAYTQTGRAELTRSLDDIRRSGFSFVDQELALGLRSLGVPIVNRGGEVVAGMSISVLDNQLGRDEMLARYLAPLQKSSLDVTEAMPV